jgi:hypothetical protein
MSERYCEGCGQLMHGETPKLVSLVEPNRILVRPYCSQKCAAPTVKSFIARRKCTWCGGDADPRTWKLGSFGEPYCHEECYRAAGAAMFDFEFRQGNI